MEHPFENRSRTAHEREAEIRFERDVVPEATPRRWNEKDVHELEEGPQKWRRCRQPDGKV